jgi:hypothetical protein
VAIDHGSYGPALIVAGDHAGEVAHYDDDAAGQGVVYLGEPFASEYVLVPRTDLEMNDGHSLCP